MLQNAKVRSIVLQGAVIAGLAGIIALLAVSTASNLASRGIPLGFDFLMRPAGFQIAETFVPYRPRDPYWWAIIVGLINTMVLSLMVIVASSILGLVVGIGRLSSNPLVSGTCRVWVEIARNTPPIILLIFLYALWWKVLPQAQQAWNLAPGVFLSIRGLVLPRVSADLPAAAGLVPLAIVLAILMATQLGKAQQARRGRRPHYVAWTVALSLAAVLALAWLWADRVSLSMPQFQRANFAGGAELTPELTTIVLGLTLYTTGFIAEIVRGGILAIGKGQWEAASALGLKRDQALRLIIVPQTLRMIVPPLNSQYINVVKNSTLAIAVGFQDFMTVVSTVINRSSHAIEGIAILLALFLALNLTLSAAMNAYNRSLNVARRR